MTNESSFGARFNDHQFTILLLSLLFKGNIQMKLPEFQKQKSMIFTLKIKVNHFTLSAVKSKKLSYRSLLGGIRSHFCSAFRWSPISICFFEYGPFQILADGPIFSSFELIICYQKNVRCLH